MAPRGRTYGMAISNDPNWWRQAVVYQVYPRSFADSNGDGIGDIAGVTSRVGYLAALGVDAVWLSPFYPSALADGGYDVDDYRDVDPKLGTLADFNQMVAALHGAGIRVVIDIVPNHTSDRHLWFTEALAAGRGSEARERYIFRDGLGENGELPPTDWESIFGGPAWIRVSDGQWYLHNFAVEQPDLNWDHPDVQPEFLKTLKFWADRGVDGFRIDVASMLAKDLSAQPLPTWAEIKNPKLWGPGQHPLWDRDEVLDIYREWRELFNQYDPPRVAVAEAFVPPDRKHLYAAADGLGQIFNFDLLFSNYNINEYREVIERNLRLSEQSGSSNTWVLSNHDQVRHLTKMGLPPEPPRDNPLESVTARLWDLNAGKTIKFDEARGARRARAAIMLLFALPGSTYIYQGEELGLPSVTGIPDSARQDPTFFTNPGVDVGRDGCRVPLPWVAGAPSCGFGPTTASHLPQPANWGNYAVDVESADAGSFLNFYRQAIALRRELQTAERLDWLDAEAGKDVLAFERPAPAAGGKRWLCASNFGTTPMPMPAGELLLASQPLPDPAQLPGETTVWLAR